MSHAPLPARRAALHVQTLAGREHTLLVGRAAAGIWAALRVWGFQDRVVLLPANTCYMVLWAVLKSGNRPLLVDVDARTANLSLEHLDAALRESPAAVIPCHMYGLPAPMQAITGWARAHAVKVIEDAALALGAQVDGTPAGGWGEAAVFSFGLGKVVDHQLGGALLTDDAAFAREARRLLAAAPRWDDRLLTLTNQWNGLYWPLHQYETQTPPLVDLYPALFALYGDLTVYHLPAADWADLPRLLRNLPQNLEHRTRLTALYDAQLQSAPHLLPALVRPAGSSLWRYPLLVSPERRDALLSYLWEQDFHQVTRWYPALRPMTLALAPHVPQPETPAAQALGASIINLPLDEHTTPAAATHIITLITAFLAS